MGNLRNSDLEVSRNYAYTRYSTNKHRGHHGLRHDTFVYQLDGVDVLTYRQGILTTSNSLTFIDSDNPYGYTLSELAGATLELQSEGVTLPQRNTINFTGTGVTVTDSTTATIIDIDTVGSSGVTQNDIEANVTVGGVTTGDSFLAGSNLEDIVANILQAYIPPRTLGLAVGLTPSSTVYEVGAAVTIGAATWSVVNDSDGLPPQNMYLSGPGFNTVVTGTSQAVTPGTVVQPTSQTNTTWVLSGEDSNNVAIANRTFNRSWRFMHLFGANTNNYNSGATTSQVQALLDSLQQPALTSSRSRTVTCTAVNNDPNYYTYIAYAASHGALSDVKQGGVLSILSNFDYLGTFNYTNSQGHTEPYRVYKNVDPGAFGVGIELVIS